MAEVFSVWALAPGHHPGLKEAARNLREIYGGPEVEAHVTVLGAQRLPQEEAMAKLQTLCAALPPIRYRISGVAHGCTYFQCVYLTVDPSPQTMEANARAKTSFEAPELENDDYMPHLSLLYGDLKEEDKQSAKALTEEKYGDILNDSEFLVTKLSLYATDTEDKLLTTWRKVAEYPLQGQK